MTGTQIKILAVFGALVGMVAVFTAVVLALEPGPNTAAHAKATVAPNPVVETRAALASRTTTPSSATASVTSTATGVATASATPVRIGVVLRAPGVANIRGGPGVEFSLLATLQPGDEVAASGRNADGTWLLVTNRFGTGWIAADVVTVVNGTAAALAVVPTPALPRLSTSDTPLPSAPPVPAATAPPAPTRAPVATQAPVTAAPATAAPATLPPATPRPTPTVAPAITPPPATAAPVVPTRAPTAQPTASP